MSGFLVRPFRSGKTIREALVHAYASGLCADPLVYNLAVWFGWEWYVNIAFRGWLG